MDAAEMLSSGHSRSHSPKTRNIQILDSGSLFPHAASVILLSMHADEDYVIRGLNAGVKGYILKESVERDLPLALEAVSKRRHFFSSAISEVLLQDYIRQLKQDSYDRLTEREEEVFQLIAEGKTNKDVAGLLNLSPPTIESHRANLMQKLGLHSTADIILYAVRKRIIS